MSEQVFHRRSVCQSVSWMLICLSTSCLLTKKEICFVLFCFLISREKLPWFDEIWS